MDSTVDPMSMLVSVVQDVVLKSVNSPQSLQTAIFGRYLERKMEKREPDQNDSSPDVLVDSGDPYVEAISLILKREAEDHDFDMDGPHESD